MAYNEFLADRISQSLAERHVKFEEKKMFGGMAYMVDDKMCVGVSKDQLMARIDPELYDEILKKPGAKPMELTGRPMKGFIFVDSEGVDADEQLAEWIQLCLDYNPFAKASKKKKKK